MQIRPVGAESSHADVRTDGQILHDRPSCLCCPSALSVVGDPLSGNGCGSQNHIKF